MSFEDDSVIDNILNDIKLILGLSRKKNKRNLCKSIDGQYIVRTEMEYTISISCQVESIYI